MLLNAVPSELTVAYWAKVGHMHFPATVQELPNGLKSVEEILRTSSLLLEKSLCVNRDVK